MCVSINVPHRLTCFCKRLTHKSGSEKILPGTALNLFGILCAQQRYESQLSSRMLQHAPVNVFHVTSRHWYLISYFFKICKLHLRRAKYLNYLVEQRKSQTKMANQWKFMFPGIGLACALLMHSTPNLALSAPRPIKKGTRKIVSIHSERSFSQIYGLVTAIWQ